MSGKKKKKASDDLLNSVLDELNSDDPTVVGPLAPGMQTDGSALGNAILDSSDHDSNHGGKAAQASSSESQYQSERELPAGIDSKTAVYNSHSSGPSFQPSQPAVQDKTAVIQQQQTKISEATAYTTATESSDKTVVVGVRQNSPARGAEVEEKVSFGSQRGQRSTQSSSGGSSTDAHLLQAENFKMAQDRILALEREIEKLREENEVLSSASELAKEKNEELIARVNNIERAKAEQYDQAQAEIDIYKDSVSEKDKELSRLREKVDELEARLKADLRKIRVRERELENRLELSKLEKNALVKSKDETILEMKRALDQVTAELESYKQKNHELSHRIEQNQVQFGRTVRALRLALANLEAGDQQEGSITPLKKAE